MAKFKSVDVVINKELCKSCEICVEFCPHDVLEMYDTKARVKNIAACTACGLCEMYCPDFAIQVIVEPDPNKKEKE